MKPRKRGRRPLGRKAMTAAQRQAKRRAKLRNIARQQLTAAKRAPPTSRRRDINKPRRSCSRKVTTFERARREFGFEEGVFVSSGSAPTAAAPL
jgi:hypothetical protein